MTTNPVNPRGSPSEPDKTKTADTKKFREEMQKIEKVGEVDPDERSRKKNKQLAAQMGDQDDALDIAPPPSPLNTSFHQKASPTDAVSSSRRSVSSASSSPPSTTPPPSPMAPSAKASPAATPVPSPAYSPPPTVQTTPTTTISTPSPTPLPSSQQFWGSVDVSTSSPSSSNQTFTEQSSYRSSPPIPSPGGKPTQSEESEESQAEEEPPVGGPSVSKKTKLSKDGETGSSSIGESVSETSKPKKQKKGTSPEGASLEKGESKESSKKQEKEPKDTLSEKEFPGLQTEEKKGSPLEPRQTSSQKSLSDLSLPAQTPTKESDAAKLTINNKEEPKAAPFPTQTSQEGRVSQKGDPKTGGIEGVKEKLAPPSSVGEQKTDQEKEGQGESKTKAPLAAPLALPQFDTSMQPLVQSAVTQAAPYLRPETMALFTQMVGSIYVSTSQNGISTTEVALTSPAFKNSIFYGSTITIEKYATAPDSLNIRLTGSNDAVKTFNDNLSSLVAAFQNGNFKFRIGRIDTAYKVDKPVLSRKEKEKDSGGFKDQKQQ